MKNSEENRGYSSRAKNKFKAIKYDQKQKGKCQTQENLEVTVIPKS